MEFTVYKKTEEVDEYVGKGAKKKKQKGSKEASPGMNKVFGLVSFLILSLL